MVQKSPDNIDVQNSEYNLCRKHGSGSRSREDEVIQPSSGYYKTRTTFNLEDIGATEGSRKYERYKKMWEMNNGKYSSSTRAKNNRIYCLRYIEIISSRLRYNSLFNSLREMEAKRIFRRLNGDDFGSIRVEEYIHGTFALVIDRMVQELSNVDGLDEDKTMEHRSELRDELKKFHNTVNTSRSIENLKERVEEEV